MTFVACEQVFSFGGRSLLLGNVETSLRMMSWAFSLPRAGGPRRGPRGTQFEGRVGAARWTQSAGAIRCRKVLT